MVIALATSHGRMAPCFAGTDLRIVSADGEASTATVLGTEDWHPLAWGTELAMRGVDLLICAGIDLATWSAVQGHDIAVIPDAMGEAETVWKAWLAGDLAPPASWPPSAATCCGKRCRRRRRGA